MIARIVFTVAATVTILLTITGLMVRQGRRMIERHKSLESRMVKLERRMLGKHGEQGQRLARIEGRMDPRLVPQRQTVGQ